ncbi:MAG: diphthine synthase [Euryarchaeota archaeon]|nr:diphthine synthase [Euryarchaeota archaeon]
MLAFIGLGLYDERDITLRALELLRRCDHIFAELYTSHMPGLSLSRLEALAGRKITPLTRQQLESSPEVLLEPAERGSVALLVPGDPLISTTHAALRIEAKRRGIETQVVHNASIVSAAPSLSGLHNYKFGRSATVARPEDGFFPETPYDVVKENLSRGLHTLLFLDIKAEEGYMMHAREALEVLLAIEERRGEGVVSGDTLAVVVSAAGSPEAGVRAGKVEELLDAELGALPHTLIIPGELHFMEEEYLREFASLRER